MSKAKEVVYPIRHWSHSSMMQWLSNRLMFKKKYILMVRDDKTGVAGTIGKACHHAAKVYFGGSDEHIVPAEHEEAAAIAIQAGLDWLDNLPEHMIDYKKTGTREKLLQTYNRSIRWYLESIPTYGEILLVEDRLEGVITLPDGRELGLPAVGYPDLVVRLKTGEIAIIDHKFISSYTAEDEEDPKKVLQSMFLYHLVKTKLGEAPSFALFNELKTSKNTDGSKQFKPWGIEYGKVPHYFDMFYALYDQCTQEIASENVRFLPNFNDLYDAKESFMLMVQGLLDVDMSDIIIDHSTKNVKYMQKESKFIGSQLDSASAIAYTPEEKIKIKLGEFGVPVKPQETNVGPSVIQYTFKPSSGVSVKRIKAHAQDIAVALGVEQVRIVAPIPGTTNIGIEVPRSEREICNFSNSYLESGTLNIPIGLDTTGQIVKKSLTDMPHLLIAGATGAGKSVFINTVIRSLTEQNSASRLKLVLIDPKRVELVHWSDLPHLDGQAPIYDVNQAIGVLNSLTDIMDARYDLLKDARARNIDAYNKNGGSMEYIVVVIDEFADLMLQAKIEKRKDKGPNISSLNKQSLQEIAMNMGLAPWGNKPEVLARIKEAQSEDKNLLTAEEAVVRIAQMARAVGIHLVIGTQRPSVDVITGIIKANMPTRVAFMTSSYIDSQVVLDQPGAEQLLGKGDMLFLDPSKRGLQRLQGLFTE